jgi:PhoPQ-activated pathogenicity-related protein
MTKAAVRALDTITSFCASDEGGKHKVDEFVVCGGSKRGWTTWLVGSPAETSFLTGFSFNRPLSGCPKP